MFQAAADLTTCMEPLRSVGVDNFDYQISYDDGFNTRLTTYPDWRAYYYQQQLFKHNQLEQHDHTHISGIIPWPDILTSTASKPLVEQMSQFGFHITEGVLVMQLHSDYKELFHFSTKRFDCATLMQQRSALYQFILHFKTQAATLIEEAKNQKFKLIESDPSREKVHNVIETFYAATPCKRFYVDTQTYLTPSELNIVQQLIQGKQLTAIAKQLSISPKTIEHQMSCLKQKFECKTLCQLGKKLGTVQHYLLETRDPTPGFFD